MSRVSTDELLFVCLPLRVPRAPNGHQRMPTEASGERLVQPSSREAEAENNRNCAALPQQTTGARVLHLALPWGGGGKASPLTLPPLSPVSCPNTGTQAHTTIHTCTHTPPLFCTHKPPTTVLVHTQTHTCTHRIFIFILYNFVIYMNTYISTVCLWLLDQSVKNHAKVGKKQTTFLCCGYSLKIWTAEVQQWTLLLVFRFTLCGKTISACL